MIYAEDGGSYAEFFAASGFRFTGAQTAAEGLAQAVSLLPDLIVLDFGLDGETVATLRGNVLTSAIPIIALTDICRLRPARN
jgi:DNA-binding response OmpR family regulator